MEVIIITGLSGAGKSQAVNCMEDLGYYCIDNMPPRLIGEFLSLAETGTSGIDKAAFVVDIRQRISVLWKSLMSKEIRYRPAKSEKSLSRRYKFKACRSSASAQAI